MADTPTKIRDLPIATVRTGTDVVEVSQVDGTSRQMQLDMLAPTTLPPSGPAGGGLAGTYPNPSLVGGPLTLYAPLASPTFTGDPKAPTPVTSDNDTSIATTAFVKAAIGAAGHLALYQEVLLAANAANMAVSWPTGARKVEIEYFVQNAGNVGDTVDIRAMVNGTPTTSNNYATQYLYGTGSTASAGLVSPATVWQGLGGMINTKGTLKPAVTAAQSFVEHTQVGNSASAGYFLGAYHWGVGGANMNGIQLFNASGTQFAAGSFLRVYVVP